MVRLGFFFFLHLGDSFWEINNKKKHYTLLLKIEMSKGSLGQLRGALTLLS